MNLKCTLCNQEGVWDCPILKNLICDACCLYDMKQEGAPEYVQQRTGKKMSWTIIVETCSKCKHRYTA